MSGKLNFEFTNMEITRATERNLNGWKVNFPTLQESYYFDSLAELITFLRNALPKMVWPKKHY